MIEKYGEFRVFDFSELGVARVSVAMCGIERTQDSQYRFATPRYACYGGLVEGITGGRLGLRWGNGGLRCADRPTGSIGCRLKKVAMRRMVIVG